MYISETAGGYSPLKNKKGFLLDVEGTQVRNINNLITKINAVAFPKLKVLSQSTKNTVLFLTLFESACKDSLFHFFSVFIWKYDSDLRLAFGLGCFCFVLL